MPDWLENVGDWIAPIDAGTWPEWLAAIGTVGTLAAAVLVLKGESQDRRDRERYARSSQARQVLLGQVESGPASGQRGRSADRTYRITVTNGSDDAIHSVILGLRAPADQMFEGQEPSKRIRRDVLARGASLDLTFQMKIKWEDAAADPRAKIPTVDCRPSLAFTDMAGQRWMRGGDYRLRRYEVADVTKGWFRKRRVVEASLTQEPP